MREKPETHTSQCGCKLKLFRQGYGIVYCPVHDAAPDMLKALKRLLENASASAEKWNAAVDEAEAAIDKAEKGQG